MGGREEEEMVEYAKRKKDLEGNSVAELSVEQVFDGKDLPSWKEQLTFRSFVVSAFLGIMFSVIVMKLNVTTGIIPSLNVSAGLLGFFFVKVWSKLLEKCGLLKQPFTRQENTVIQTCVVAISGLAFSGGFGSYMFAMSDRIAKQKPELSDPLNVKNPHLGWMIGFMFVVSFLGLFSLVPLRKIMIIDYKLSYPSGTATAHLINSFHTPHGAKLAQQQVKELGKYFSFSFLWSMFQWFFKAGDGCGFESFPSLGLQAYKNRFYFDFSLLYVGVGMICPYLVNISVLIGGILSWGIMWPMIDKKAGIWYPADLPKSNIKSLQGYKIFISIAMILGDGLYNFFKVLGRTIMGFTQQIRSKGSTQPVGEDGRPSGDSAVTYDDQRRTEIFLKDQIPMPIAVAGYVIVAIVSIITLPFIFPPLKWYYIVCAYIIAPALAFCNAYGCGLTDWSLASTYGKLAIFIIGAWAGAENGGVLAGLASCGVMMSIVATASDLMQDFKTGYLTLASPRSMFVSQVIGTAMGCIIAPSIFWLFYKAFPTLGNPDSEYPAPYAGIYRSMAVLGVEGLGSLPAHCLTLCYVFFACSMAVNLLRDVVGKNVSKYIPIPMAMAIPFYLGSYFAIDMCIGSLILFAWESVDKAKAEAFAPALASGLICGDGLWALPSALLSLAGVQPPICMKFLSRSDNARVDGFLNGS